MILLDMLLEEKVKQHTMELACSMKRTIFCRLELLTYWWYYLNELGEGIAVDFPTKLKTSLTHSKKYFMSCSGQIKLVPNFPVEKVVIFQQNSM